MKNSDRARRIRNLERTTDSIAEAVSNFYSALDDDIDNRLYNKFNALYAEFSSMCGDVRSQLDAEAERLTKWLDK